MPELVLTNPQGSEPDVVQSVIHDFYYPLANSKYHRVLRSIEFVFANDGISDPSFRITLANHQTIDVPGLSPERAADKQLIAAATKRAFEELGARVDPKYLREMDAVSLP